MSDLLKEVEDSLDRCGCQFWACDGPTMRPVPMLTCHRCIALARVRHDLGLPIRTPEEDHFQRETRRMVARP